MAIEPARHGRVPAAAHGAGVGFVTADHAPALDDLFAAPAEEAAYPVQAIRGKIPEWLSGSYYVNGPASFRVGDVRYQHWLDGDGMIAALHFDRGKPHFHSRFIGTRKRGDESQAQAAVYRTFGTRFAGDKLHRDLMLEPPVNVAVQPFAGTLLALGEQSLPLELDPVTLQTRGDYDFHGALNEVSPFAAHAKIDPADGRLVNFGVAYSANRTSLTLYEFDRDGRRISRRRHKLDAPFTIHDFALTPRYAVFHIGRYLMRVERLLAGGTLLDALDYDASRPTELLLIPRDKSEAPRTVRVEGGYCLHLINAFSRHDATIVDLILYERPLYAEYHPLPQLFQDVSPGRALRYEVQPDAIEAESVSLSDYDKAPDFPSVAPSAVSRDYTGFWCLGMSAAGQPGRKFFDQLVRVRLSDETPDLFTLPRGEFFGGEPVYIEGPQPEDALILVERFAAQSAFALFRANRIADGPIAEVPLTTKLLPGFHAAFSPREDAAR